MAAEFVLWCSALPVFWEEKNADSIFRVRDTARFFVWPVTTYGCEWRHSPKDKTTGLNDLCFI